MRLIQEPGSSLPPDILALGVDRMNKHRALWLDDLKKGLFRMEKITDSESNSIPNVGTSTQPITQSITANNRAPDNEADNDFSPDHDSDPTNNNTPLNSDKSSTEEDEEWFGFTD